MLSKWHPLADVTIVSELPATRRSSDAVAGKHRGDGDVTCRLCGQGSDLSKALTASDGTIGNRE
jgi:hypothetical protein